MKKLYLLLMIVATAGCAEANFGGKAARNGSDAIDAGDTKPVNLGDGQDERDGPTAGTGERLGKTIEVDCENSQGIIIDIGDVDDSHPEKGGGPDLGSEDYRLQGGILEDLILNKDGLDSKGDKPIVKGAKNPKGKPIITPKESNVTARVKGQFCPNSNKELTVLFVVDMSGSMGHHIPNAGAHKGQDHPGYDPQVNGSCGRLRAAEAIMARIASQMTEGDNVKVGMLPFAGGILSDKYIDITDFAQFGAMMNKDTFCQYVVQSASFGYDPQNPGGIDGRSGLFGFGSVDSSTNYNAAFKGATTSLRDVYGRKVVYFISDGEPTSGGVDPVAAGIAAGEDLRSSVDNLSMNALLLGNPGPHAREVLELVAGSPQRVRAAEQADELAQQILNFPNASIDPATAQAILSIQPYGSTDIGFKYFREAAGLANVWEYETVPFTLLGTPDAATVNLLEILAEGTDGSTHSAVFRIRFHR